MQIPAGTTKMVVNSKFLMPYVGKPCVYCQQLMTASGKKMPTRDHVFPKCQGFKFSRPGNMVICCHKCNGAKGRHHIITWWSLLHKGNDPRALIVFKFIAHYYAKGWIYSLPKKRVFQAFKTELSIFEKRIIKSAVDVYV